MFGVSLPELILIFVVVLLVLGPEKLPEIARTLGKLTGEFRKHSNELRREFYNSVYTPSADLRTRINSEMHQLKSVANTPPEPAQQPAAEIDDERASFVCPQDTAARAAAKAAQEKTQADDPGYVEEKKR